MSSPSPYHTAKLAHLPQALDALRAGVPQAPTLVQIFPTNVCPHACDFCSYGAGPESVRRAVANPAREAWKNQALFHGRDVLPLAKMRETIRALALMEVRAVEVSGGGEPLSYPWFDELVALLGSWVFDVGIVTNGTLLTPARAEALGALPFAWARVSIDAGSLEDYVAIRHCPESHWNKAWEAVRLLANQRRHPEARVGVGFVVDRHNWRGVEAACVRAKAEGADNVRLAMSFTPEGAARWDAEALAAVHEQVDQAQQSLADDTFHIYDLTRERRDNVVHGRQEYPFCAWKEIGCVVGADQQVYACCSWAYHPAGRMFSIAEQDFHTGWFGEGAAWRAQHDPRRDCRIHCLYERRNHDALRLMMDREHAAAVAAEPAPPHLNFP